MIGGAMMRAARVLALDDRDAIEVIAAMEPRPLRRSVAVNHLLASPRSG
jgi:hypothetical protein